MIDNRVFICPVCGRYMIRQWDLTKDPPEKLEKYRCVNCALQGRKYIFTTVEVNGEMKDILFTKKFNNTIIEFEIKATPKKGYWAQNVQPAIDTFKALVPGTAREFNFDTKKWGVAAEYWEPVKLIFEHTGFLIREVTEPDGPKIEVPKEYAENFHYEPELVKESAITVAKQLSQYLGVEITTQELSELKKLYRQKAREYHPDYGGDADKMSELNRLWTLYCNTDEVKQ